MLLLCRHTVLVLSILAVLTLAGPQGTSDREARYKGKATTAAS